MYIYMQIFLTSRSAVDLLTVVSGRIAGTFNRSEATRTEALDISKAFDRVWHADHLNKLKLMEFWVRYLAFFCLFSVPDHFMWF